MATTAPPTGAFCYIETATNGARNRNQVMPVADFQPSADAVDCYATICRFTDDLLTYLETNRNAKGKPSVLGYPGPALLDRIVWDFDHEEDPNQALTDARRFAQNFCSAYDVPASALRFYFSGSKGFHIEAPVTLFGGLPPLTDLRAIKTLALEIGADAPTLDPTLYEKLRLYRQPNTRHGKTGLYKIPLTRKEFSSLSLNQIRELAIAPREIDTTPDDEWEARPELIALRDTALRAADTASTNGRATSNGSASNGTYRTLTPVQAKRVVAIVAPYWSEGQRHELALLLAGYLAKAYISERTTLAIIEQLSNADEETGDRAKAVHSTYERVANGQETRGFQGLRELLTPGALHALECLVNTAKVRITIGGRLYQRGDGSESGADTEADPENNTADADDADQETEQYSDPEDEPDESDEDEDDMTPIDRLRQRAETAPQEFIRDTLADAEAVGALALAARDDRAAYEGLMLWLRDIGVKAGDIQRLERTIADAVKRTKPKFRVVGPDEEAVGRRVKDALPSAPVTDAAVVPLGYQLTPSGVVEEHLTDDGDTKRVAVASTPLVVTGRLIDINDNKESLRLAWQRDGRWREHTSSRVVTANARDLVGLADIGFPVTSRNAGDLVGYVAAYEAANLTHLPRARVSNQMGWQGPDGELGFLWGRTLIRPSGDDAGDIDIENVPPEDWREDWVAFHGADAGDAQIADAFGQEGTFEGWVQAAQIASAYPRVALALYGSLATAILEILGAPNFVIDWPFVTSTGKTTTLRVGASCWGNPNEQAAASLVGTWDATRVYIERLSTVLNGLPLFLDDTKRAKNPKLVGQVVYDVVSGRGRGRGSPRGMRRSGSWATVLLSTGESPATSFTEDGGTRARVLTLWGPPFGKADASTAPVVQGIDLGVRSNYGHAGPRFVRYLVSHRDEWDAWRNEYRRTQTAYAEKAGGNPVGGRLAAYFAVLDMAALLAHDALQLPWDYRDPVEGLWSDLLHEATEADRAAAALTMVLSWAQANQHTFDGRLPIDPPLQAVSGRWDRDDEWKLLAFFPHKLKTILSDGGFDADAIVRTWHDRGWLETDANEPKRHTKRMRIQGSNARAICIHRSAIEEVAG